MAASHMQTNQRTRLSDRVVQLNGLDSNYLNCVVFKIYVSVIAQLSRDCGFSSCKRASDFMKQNLALWQPE